MSASIVPATIVAEIPLFETGNRIASASPVATRLIVLLAALPPLAGRAFENASLDVFEHPKAIKAARKLKDKTLNKLFIFSS